jgi:hypothetical protein
MYRNSPRPCIFWRDLAFGWSLTGFLLSYHSPYLGVLTLQRLGGRWEMVNGGYLLYTHTYTYRSYRKETGPGCGFWNWEKREIHPITKLMRWKPPIWWFWLGDSLPPFIFGNSLPWVWDLGTLGIPFHYHIPRGPFPTLQHMGKDGARAIIGVIIFATAESYTFPTWFSGLAVFLFLQFYSLSMLLSFCSKCVPICACRAIVVTCLHE